MRMKDLTSRIGVVAKHTFVVETEVQPPVNLDHHCIPGVQKFGESRSRSADMWPLLNRGDPVRGSCVKNVPRIHQRDEYIDIQQPNDGHYTPSCSRN